MRHSVSSVSQSARFYGGDAAGMSGADPVGGRIWPRSFLFATTSLNSNRPIDRFAVGLYGVTAYSVEKRTNEIGVRMALGADRGRVVLMVLREAFWMVGVGLALGIPAAIGAGNLIASQLFGVQPWDPLILSVAVLLLGVASLLAATIPARRATRVDPMIALRYE